MQLKYVNQAAKTQDIQVPGIQVEPMIHLHVYEVDKAVGLALLASDPKHWKEVLPKEEKAKLKDKPKGKRAIKPEAVIPSDQWQYPYPPVGDNTAEESWDELDSDDDFDDDYSYVPQADDKKESA